MEIILGCIALILGVQLGRIQTQLYRIEKHLDAIETRENAKRPFY